MLIRHILFLTSHHLTYKWADESSWKEKSAKAVGSRCLILSDLWMPEVNGEQFADRLAADPNTADIPLVAITADTQIEPKNSKPYS